MILLEVAGGILLAGLVLTFWRGIVLGLSILMGTSIIALFVLSVIEKVAR